MGDRLQYVNGRNYQRIDNGVGVSFQLDYGFRVDYEHVFTSSTDNLGDMNLVRLRYDLSADTSPVTLRLPGLQVHRRLRTARLRRLRRKPGQRGCDYPPARRRRPASCRENNLLRFCRAGSGTSDRNTRSAGNQPAEGLRCWRFAVAQAGLHQAGR